MASITKDSIIIWYAKPCVPIISHRRSQDSLDTIGENILVVWRPDSSMLCVATEGGHLVFYNLVVLTEISSLYTQQDSDNPALRRDSDELYFKENVPPLVFSQAYEVVVPGGVTDAACIRDELMVSTKNGHILRYMWDGQVNRDYCLDLRRIPFCMDQQVLRAVPLVDTCHVTSLSYSPLLGGFSIVLSDGRAACLVSNSLKFDPNGVQVTTLNIFCLKTTFYYSGNLGGWSRGRDSDCHQPQIPAHGLWASQLTRRGVRHR